MSAAPSRTGSRFQSVPEPAIKLLAGSVVLHWGEVAAVHEASATAAYRHIFNGPFPRAEAAERWRTYAGSLMLAVQGSQTLGFAAWSEPMLDALYVLSDFTGRGIGAQLLSSVPREARELWVLVDNLRGRRFYEQQGWADTGIVRVAYEPVTEVLYRR